MFVHTRRADSTVPPDSDTAFPGARKRTVSGVSWIERTVRGSVSAPRPRRRLGNTGLVWAVRSLKACSTKGHRLSNQSLVRAEPSALRCRLRAQDPESAMGSCRCVEARTQASQYPFVPFGGDAGLREGQSV